MLHRHKRLDNKGYSSIDKHFMYINRNNALIKRLCTYKLNSKIYLKINLY